MILDIEKCPFCGEHEFIEAIQKGYGDLQGESLFAVAHFKHTVCRNCGSIVRSYVDDPEELLKFKNRKER